MLTKLLNFFSGGWMAWAAALGIAGVLAALWFGFHRWQESLRQEGRDEIQAEWDLDANERRLAATGQQEIEREKGAQHEANLKKEREQRAQDAVVVGTVLAGNTVELDRLRRTTAARAAGAVQACSGPGAGPGADGAAAAGWAVLDECAGRLVAVADQTERMAIQLRGLQSWASSAVMVCGDDRPP